MPATHPHHLDLTLAFLRDLKAHNDREWFTANRERYDTARAAFEDVVDDVILAYNEVEPVHGLQTKDCVYRIYRDVRFSGDKSPYKTAMSASIGPGGRKSQRLNLYVHIEPEGCFVATGLYAPTPEQIKRVRAAIAEDARPLRAVLNAKDFKKHFGALSGERLKSAPRGYAADHPDADLLAYKQYLAIRNLPEDLVLGPKLVPQLIASAHALRPFCDYFNRLLAL